MEVLSARKIYNRRNEKIKISGQQAKRMRNKHAASKATNDNLWPRGKVCGNRKEIKNVLKFDKILISLRIGRIKDRRQWVATSRRQS